MKCFFACLCLHFPEKRSLGKKLMQIFKRVILIRSNTRMYHAITCFWSRSKTIKSHLLVVFCPEPYQVFYRLFWGLTHSWQWHNLDNRVSKFHFYACLQRFRPLTTLLCLGHGFRQDLKILSTTWFEEGWHYYMMYMYLLYYFFLIWLRL